MIKFLTFSILILSFGELSASELPYMNRSPRAQLMGDAYTAVADDEYTLFYNPASLGKNKGISFTPINPLISGTNVLGDTDRFKDFPKEDPSAIADRILNYPVSVHASAVPGLKLGNFGFSLFASSKTNMVLRNAIHPFLDVDYRYDRGFIVGYAYNIGTGALSSRIKKTSKTKVTTGNRLSLGASLKHVSREGIEGQYDLFGTTLLNKINSGATKVNDLKDALGYSTGKAWGVDLGVEYARASGRNLFTAGIAILDVGNTHFSKTKGIGEVPEQEMTINTGAAFKQDFGIFDYTLSADIRPLTSDVSDGRKFHFGSEFSFPIVTLNAGWSEGYVSYGGTIRFWPFKLTAGLYGIEVGSKFREQEAKRFVIAVSLFDFSFDI